jgi:hypothetical protein
VKKSMRRVGSSSEVCSGVYDSDYCTECVMIEISDDSIMRDSCYAN